MRIRVYPCSLQDRSQCASAAELAGAESTSATYVGVASYNNESDPVKYFINSDSRFFFNIASRGILTRYLKENFIFDDDSDFLDSSMTHSYIDIDKEVYTTSSRLSASTYFSEVQINSGSCEPYVDLVLRSGFDKVIIERRYEKFFSSVSGPFISSTTSGATKNGSGNR